MAPSRRRKLRGGWSGRSGWLQRGDGGRETARDKGWRGREGAPVCPGDDATAAHGHECRVWGNGALHLLPSCFVCASET